MPRPAIAGRDLGANAATKPRMNDLTPRPTRLHDSHASLSIAGARADNDDRLDRQERQSERVSIDEVPEPSTCGPFEVIGPSSK